MNRYAMGIDIGGTFTDVVLYDMAEGRRLTRKTLTTPGDPAEAVLSAVDQVLAEEAVSAREIERVVHATTLFTNALIERKGARTALLTTEGFRDSLEIGRERKYDLYDLAAKKPRALVPRDLRFEAGERILADGSIHQALDDNSLAKAAEALREAQVGSLAIVFLHSYRNDSHERTAGDRMAELLPDIAISLSSDVAPEIREFERASTTVANAYIKPLARDYLDALGSRLGDRAITAPLLLMLSSGGLTHVGEVRRSPVQMLESGPAAGALAAADIGRAEGLEHVLAFDMGGTTAKGALIRGGAAIKVYHQEVARMHDFKAGSGLPVKSPVIDMIEIGAGGGSIAGVDVRGTIRVGPNSAGADPGPACYGQGGGDATLTDANLVLGYLDPEFFLGGEMSLDRAASEQVIRDNIAAPLKLSLARAAWGIHEIVDEDVARAFRIHASERGFDYRGSSMIAFGGSGPVHAMGVARKLGIPRVIFPVAAGVMSALGLLASPLTFEVARTRQIFVDDLTAEDFAGTLAALEADAMAPLLEAKVETEALSINRRLDMRYHGQGHEIEVSLPPDVKIEALAQIFREHYAAVHGAALLDAPLVVTTWKVEVSATPPELASAAPTAQGEAAPKGTRQAYFGEDYVAAPVYDRQDLGIGVIIDGPALIEERESTVIIGPGDRVQVDEFGNLIAELVRLS